MKNCLTCTLFNERVEVCHLASVRPPARVIAYGCEAYKGEGHPLPLHQLHPGSPGKLQAFDVSSLDDDIPF